MKPIESKRVALNRKIVLRFPDFEGFVSEYASNLSMTGMFVRSNQPQEPGTPVSFELRLENGGSLVRGGGWVVWSRNSREAPDRPAGMGIEFTELDRNSRRLVRWMILSLLPEDQKPFEVHTGMASAPTTVGLPSRVAVRRRRRAGVLTAVVMFSGLAALVYWGRSRESGDADSRAGRASGAIQASGVDLPIEELSSRAVAGAEVVGAGSDAERIGGGADAEGAPAPLEDSASGAAGASEAGEAVEIAAVEGVVRSWAGAWSKQDVDRYLAHYASDFVPEGGLSRSQWSEHRRRRLTAPKSVRVAVIRLETRLLSDGEARVSFLQTYRSDGYADTVDKVLTLARSENGWKIRREVTD